MPAGGRLLTQLRRQPLPKLQASWGAASPRWRGSQLVPGRYPFGVPGILLGVGADAQGRALARQRHQVPRTHAYAADVLQGGERTAS